MMIFDVFPNLTTDRLTLRETTFNDVVSIFDLRSNDEINKLITRKTPEKLKDAEDFIAVCHEEFKKGNRIFWAMEFDKKVIGTIVYHQIKLENNYAEIGYELHPEYHKKGLMSEAMNCIIEFGLHKMKLKTIEAFTHKNNIASITLLEKHNFVFQSERRDKGFDNNRIWKLAVSS